MWNWHGLLFWMRYHVMWVLCFLNSFQDVTKTPCIFCRHIPMSPLLIAHLISTSSPFFTSPIWPRLPADLVPHPAWPSPSAGRSDTSPGSGSRSWRTTPRCPVALLDPCDRCGARSLQWCWACGNSPRSPHLWCPGHAVPHQWPPRSDTFPCENSLGWRPVRPDPCPHGWPPHQIVRSAVPDRALLRPSSFQQKSECEVWKSVEKLLATNRRTLAFYLVRWPPEHLDARWGWHGPQKCQRKSSVYPGHWQNTAKSRIRC